MSLIIRATYPTAADLRAHLDDLESRGAMLFETGDAPEGVKQFDELSVVVEADGDSATMKVEVLQLLDAVGLAVRAVDASEANDLCEGVKPAAERDGPSVVVGEVVEQTSERKASANLQPEPAPAPDAEPAPAPASDAELNRGPHGERATTLEDDDGEGRCSPMGPLSWSIDKLRAGWDELGFADRVRVARYGGRVARMMILRSPEKRLHAHLLSNPKITGDEVAMMASKGGLDPAVLRRISGSHEWLRHKNVVRNLVCNSKLPLPRVKRLLQRLSKEELERLSSSGKVRASVRAAIKRQLAKTQR